MVNTLITMIKVISLKIIAAMMDTIPVIIDEIDTFLEIYNVMMNVTTMITNKIGLIPNMIPPDVATAFPPLNIANNGYVLPNTANKPMIRRFKSASTNKGNNVAPVPFRISPRTTMIPAFMPNTRNEFVAPRLPLPCSRISILKPILPTINPVGMDPKIYAVIINKTYSISYPLSYGDSNVFTQYW